MDAPELSESHTWPLLRAVMAAAPPWKNNRNELSFRGFLAAKYTKLHYEKQNDPCKLEPDSADEDILLA